MNDDMPWVNLTQQEVEELRNKKHELTEYGKDKIRELMRNQEPYPDEMFEEAERREAERKALDALDEIYEKHGDAMLRLAEIEKDQWEREKKSRTENPDEIVLKDVEMFHLESMNERSLWIGCYTQDGKIYHLNIHANGDKLRYYWSDETP